MPSTSTTTALSDADVLGALSHFQDVELRTYTTAQSIAARLDEPVAVIAGALERLLRRELVRSHPCIVRDERVTGYRRCGR
jgi:hypothetical protein